MTATPKVSTCHWFDTQAEEAAKLYISLFDDSGIVRVSRYGKGTPMPEGTAMMVEFKLAGTHFMALNGGPHYKLTEASSMVVSCASQAEIDRLWVALLEGGGKESRCGWLKDRYGLSWQIVPARLGELMQEGDPVKSSRVMGAMMKMVKLDIAALEAAHRGA